MTESRRPTDILRALPLFKDATDETIQVLASHASEQRFPANTVLLEIDQPSENVYFILDGDVKITRLTSYGEETVLNILRTGDILGELGVLQHTSRSARATTVTATRLLSCRKQDFDAVLRSDHSVAIHLLRELSERIRHANGTVVQALEDQHSAIQTRFVKLNRLIEASKSINSTLDLDKLLKIILDAAATSIDADRGTVYLVDEFKRELWSKVLQGENMVEIRLPIGKGIAGAVAQTGQTINITDAYSDSRFNPEIDKRTGYHTETILCMPMRNKDGKIIGVFQLLNKKNGVFDEADEQFIDALSAHAAVAIENARIAQEMVQSERLSAVGRMASTIIHDIKNPMGTLRVYAQVMKKKSGNEEAAKLADEMIHQVDRFVNMAQEILDFTRGVSSLNMAKEDFADVMEGVLGFIENDLNKHNITLVRKAEFSGKVTMDKDKIIRVFYNIASNARDAMPEGGTLTVATAESNGMVKIEFIDSGTGMPEEVKRRIFEPFVTHGKKHGTGLGMAIVKKVIDDHKGSIEIESELGKGTTIRLFLPHD